MDISKQAFQIEAQIARAWTLPASLYTDASVFATERENILTYVAGSRPRQPGGESR